MLNTTISLVGGSTVNRERIEAELTGYWLAALPIDPRAVRACVCACVKDLLPDVIGIENIFTAQSEHACIYAHWSLSTIRKMGCVQISIHHTR